MSDLGAVCWRLTVRDLQGELIFGPRVYLSDKTMRGAVKRWTAEDRSLLREFATRGAWQSLEGKPVTGADDPWHAEPCQETQAEWERRATEQFGPSPRDQEASAFIEDWNAMTPEERGAYLESIDPRWKTRS